MAYNHGREDRKWRIWKEAEEKLLRECGVDEATIEQIRMADRADFNSNRRFYRWTNDVAEYLEDMADRERQTEVGTVAELLDEIESENPVSYTHLDVYKRQRQHKAYHGNA